MNKQTKNPERLQRRSEVAEKKICISSRGDNMCKGWREQERAYNFKNVKLTKRKKECKTKRSNPRYG